MRLVSRGAPRARRHRARGPAHRSSGETSCKCRGQREAASPPYSLVCRSLRCSRVQWQAHRGRYPERQVVVRIVHEHAHLVEQAGAELLGFHRLGREFGDRRHEADPSLKLSPGEAVDRHEGAHAGACLAKVRFGHVGTHPFRIDDRERMTPSSGALSSASASCWRRNASWASLPRNCASAWSMSSWRGPAIAKSSAFWLTSTRASATPAAASAASASCWLAKFLPSNSFLRPNCRRALTASALADSRLALACAISSGRLPWRSRSTTARCAATCAATWATCGSRRLVSRRASTSPLCTRSPSCTKTAAMRSLLLKGRATWRRSTLPYKTSSTGALLRWVNHHPATPAPAAAARNATTKSRRLTPWCAVEVPTWVVSSTPRSCLVGGALSSVDSDPGATGLRSCAKGVDVAASATGVRALR